MKLTKEQIEQVKDEVVLFAQNQLGLGFCEADNMAESLLSDIVADIEETADWSDLEDDEVCLGDITIAIGRVITKRLNKKQKVYALITQWSVDYEDGSNCGLYATKELAQKEMKRDYEYMRDDYPEWECSISDDCAEMQEEGDYTRNHCTWDIREMEVISE